MSNISDNELDKLFNDAAKGFDSPYEEEVWANVEHKLGGAGGGSLSYFKQVGGVLGGVVVVVSLLIGTQIERAAPDSNVEAFVSKEQSSDKSQNQGTAESSTDNYLSESKVHGSDGNDDQMKEPIINQSSEVPSSLNNTSNAQPHQALADNKESIYQPTKLKSIEANLIYSFVLPDRSFNKVQSKTPQNEKENMTSLQLGLKAIYAPDLSSVGYFSPDRPGSNFGLVAELYFADRWYIGTGAILSRKIYNTDKAFESYSAQYDIDYVDAECRVIDIPLNIGYSLIKNENQSFYVSTGLSTYIMLSEDYEFESSGYYPRQWSEKYENENSHVFGILNLSIGYERRISQQFFIQLEPFLKSPIDGVGEGKVNLVSTGAMFNLKYVFSKENRP